MRDDDLDSGLRWPLQYQKFIACPLLLQTTICDLFNMLTPRPAHTLRCSPPGNLSCTKVKSGCWLIRRWHDHVQRKHLSTGTRSTAIQISWSCDAFGWLVFDWWMGCFGFCVEGTDHSVSAIKFNSRFQMTLCISVDDLIRMTVQPDHCHTLHTTVLPLPVPYTLILVPRSSS